MSDHTEPDISSSVETYSLTGMNIGLLVLIFCYPLTLTDYDMFSSYH